MAVTIRQSVHSPGTGSGQTVTLPMAPKAGNLLVMGWAKRNGGAAGITVPTGWTFTGYGSTTIRVGDVAGGDSVRFMARVSDGSEQSVFYSSTKTEIMCYELEGAAIPANLADLSGEFHSAFGQTGESIGQGTEGFDSPYGYKAHLNEQNGLVLVLAIVDENSGTLAGQTILNSFTLDEASGNAENGGGHPYHLFLHKTTPASGPVVGWTGGKEAGHITLVVPSDHGPTGAALGPSLLVEYFTNDPTTFGPLAPDGIILDAVKIGWSWYSRYPANAFFTLRANSIHNTRLKPLQTHIRVHYYNPQTGYSRIVFSGRLSEPDHSGEDVVWTAWNYLSELSLSRTGYRTLYPAKLLGTEIAAVEWAAARTATYALLNFVATGTIENPLGTDNVTPIKTDNRFGVIDVPRLLLMFDLTEIGRANTVHNVTMGISREPPHTFSFLKDAGTAITGKRLVYPGNVRDFRYVPGYAALRNDLATIGTSADGGSVEIVKTDEVNAALYGRRQDVFTIKTLQGEVGAATEADAQNAITARAVKESTTLGQSILLDVRPELVEPFDGWDIEDTIKVEVNRGRVAINDTYRIIGCRGLLDERGYHPQIYIQLPTQA